MCDPQLPLVIKNPHALPMYREDDNRGRKRPHELAADEAVRTKRPDPGQGVAGKGTGGKVGSTGGTILTQYILKNQVWPPLQLRVCIVFPSCPSSLNLSRAHSEITVHAQSRGTDGAHSDMGP